MFFKKKEEKPGGSLHALSLRVAVMDAAAWLILSLAAYVWVVILPFAETPEPFKPMHPGLLAILYISGAWFTVACPMIHRAVVLFGAWRGILFVEKIGFGVQKIRLEEVLKHPSFPPALRRWYSYTYGKPFWAWLFVSCIAIVAGFLYWQDDMVDFLVNFIQYRWG